MWTTENAMALQVPIPTIDMAVAMRDLSVFHKERQELSTVYKRGITQLTESQALIPHLEKALYTAIILTYSQGFTLLQTASSYYHYNLNLETIAEIWRGGCIIRAALLENIKQAFKTNSHLTTLMGDSYFSHEISAHQESLRKIILNAVEAGVPVPGMMVSLAYLDALRSRWLPTNLIQAQRDFFGAHTYERIDQAGTFHTDWEAQ